MGHSHVNEKYTRRDFLQRSTMGLGALSMASLLNPGSLFGSNSMLFNHGPHFAPRAKRVIYLYMIGAPSQVDLFDYKPMLHKMHGEELPPGILSDRVPSTSATQATLPLVKSLGNFAQHGQSGMWMSDLLPYMSQVTDDLCMVQSVFTESVQHEPAQMFTHTGSEIPGRPTFGAWVSYGLGSLNDNLPTFIVLMTKGNEGWVHTSLFQRLSALG